jgi:hypothetical protein
MRQFSDRFVRLSVAPRLSLGVLIGAMLALSSAGGAASATLTVCPSGCAYTTIPAALTAAHSGDTVAVGPGTYAGGFTIHASINLVGAGRRFTTISGGGSVVTIARGAKVAISRVMITGGRALLHGGGIDNDGTLTLSKSLIHNNQAGVGPFDGEGGGIFNDGGRLTLVNSTVDGNAATNGGGIRNVGGTVVVEDARITNNLGVPVGGGPPAGNGGGISNDGGASSVGTLILVQTVVAGNEAGFDASRGGGILNGPEGVASLDHSLIHGNTVETPVIVAIGGGIENEGTMTLRKTPVSLNRAIAGGSFSSGGGISNSGVLRLHESPLTRNTSEGQTAHGGGLANSGGTAFLSKSPVWRNTADSTFGEAFGGGILNGGGLTLFKSPVTANTAIAREFGSAQGGGIHNAFALFLTRIDSPVTGNAPDDCFGC